MDREPPHSPPPVPSPAPPARRARAGRCGVVTPDWMDDAEWQRSCAARGEECPAGDMEVEFWRGSDGGAPPELADVPSGCSPRRSTRTARQTRR